MARLFIVCLAAGLASVLPRPGWADDYLPRHENAAVARQLAHGAALEGRIARLHEHRNRSVRFEIEVVAPLIAWQPGPAPPGTSP
jgi:hypothetical protein